MDQTLQCYLTIFIVLVSYGTGDILCEHSCKSDNTCNCLKIQDTCYYVLKDKLRNWFESRQFCGDQGLSMVKLTRDRIEQMYNFSGLFNDFPSDGLFRAADTKTHAWLGGRAVDLPEWTFINNIKAYRPGVLMSRSNSEKQLCGIIVNNNNKFEIQFHECGNKLPFICRSDQTNWIHVSEEMPWFEARSYCKRNGGDLFFLNKQEPLSLYENSSTLSSNTTYHHIGLRHRLWEWIDGSEILSTNWDMNEPNTFSEKCLLLNVHNGKWNDSDCYQDKLTFCQGDARNSKLIEQESFNDSVTKAVGIAKPSTYHNCTNMPSDSNKGNPDKDLPIIILGSLLGVFVIITISLIIFIVCTKCSCKSLNEETEIIENNYYSSSSEHEYGQSLETSSNGTSYTSPSLIDSTVEYLYCASAAKETNGRSDFASNKPVIKPKPIIGPKTGDVYSTIDKRSCLPVKPQDKCLYAYTG